MTESLEDRNCQLCGSARKTVHFEGRLPPQASTKALHGQYAADQEHWRYQSVRCLDCGHFYASPVFGASLTDESYIEQDHDNGFGQDTRLLMKTNVGYVHLIDQHLGPARRAMLDIGCDVGHFIEACHALGFERYVGIEPSRESVAKAVNLPRTDYLQGVFHPSRFSPGEFDLITMIHVLDHLRSPKPFLEAARGLLATGGMLFVVVHNIDSLVAKISGREWHPFNLIHFDYYTEKSLAELARKAGFRVISTCRTRNYIDLRQIFLRAPYIPARLRRALVSMAGRAPLNRLFFRIPLGNIGLVAMKE